MTYLADHSEAKHRKLQSLLAWSRPVQEIIWMIWFQGAIVTRGGNRSYQLKMGQFREYHRKWDPDRKREVFLERQRYGIPCRCSGRNTDMHYLSRLRWYWKIEPLRNQELAYTFFYIPTSGTASGIMFAVKREEARPFIEKLADPRIAFWNWRKSFKGRYYERFWWLYLCEEVDFWWRWDGRIRYCTVRF